MPERTMTVRAALHLYHIEMGEGGTYRSYEYDEMLRLRTELLQAGIPESEVDGNGVLSKSDYDEEVLRGEQ